MSDLRAELLEAVDDAVWDWLMPHARRDALIWVDQRLNLADVGVAIANDRTASVQNWIAAALIHKPTQIQLSHWNAEHLSAAAGETAAITRFKALIVQPYVLIQEC